LIDFSVFRNRRVLITGQTGFKGTWLLRVLQRAGAVTGGMALRPDSPSHFELLNGSNGHQLDYIDIRTFQEVQNKVRDFNPEVIFHLAAQPLVRESYRNTRETYETNFMGGVNLLESVRDSESLRAFVFITSDKAYENVEWEWGYRESDQLGGLDPYSASKGAVEIALASYRRSIFHDREWAVSSARAGNVIGGGDFSPDRIVPDIVKSIQLGLDVEIRNPNSTRPWQHVLEPLSGYLRLAEAILKREPGIQGAYNFGPASNQKRTVLDVANRVISDLGQGRVVVKPDISSMHEARLLALNCDRASLDLGWAPRWDYDRTMHETTSWYKAWLSGQDVAQVTDSQISVYFPELKN
jgi:CDP-glucose 4,6-dehydratase